jgi:hypothetical protein
VIQFSWVVIRAVGGGGGGDGGGGGGGGGGSSVEGNLKMATWVDEMHA